MTQVAQKPNLLNQPNSFFRKGDFEALIQMKGYDLELSKACKCPCMTAENHALPSCTNCNGYGWFFINPIMTRGLLSSINLNTKFKEWSEELLGTAALTLREGQRISFFHWGAAAGLGSSPLLLAKEGVGFADSRRCHGRRSRAGKHCCRCC